MARSHIQQRREGHTRTTALEVTPSVPAAGAVMGPGEQESAPVMVSRGGLLLPLRNAGRQADIPNLDCIYNFNQLLPFFLPPSIPLPFLTNPCLPPAAKSSFLGLAELRVAKECPPQATEGSSPGQYLRGKFPNCLYQVAAILGFSILFSQNFKRKLHFKYSHLSMADFHQRRCGR